MDNSYKLYQLLSFFVTKFSYRAVQVANQRPDEVFLVGSKDRNYPLIRITTNSIEQVIFEKERLDHTISTLFRGFRITEGRFLDVHIGREEILDVEVYDSIIIDVDYYSGPDLNDYFQGIHKVLHEVSNPKSEIDSILLDLREVNKNIKTQRKAIKQSGRTKPIATYVIIGICAFMYIVYTYLLSSYGQVEALLVLGANYKPYTVGLFQFWRIITAGFLHSSLYHLFINMLSLLSLGRVMEIVMGRRKFLLVLFGSLIISSLTSLAFNDYIVTVGLSGGLYGLFAFYLITSYYGRSLNSNAVLQVIVLNLIINFLGGVDIWAHVGGFIAGIIFYFAMSDKKAFIIYFGLLIVLVWHVYLSDNTYTMSGSTDANVIETYEDFLISGYSDNRNEQIVEVWRKSS